MSGNVNGISEAFQRGWTCRLVAFFYVAMSPNAVVLLSVLKCRRRYRFFVYACKPYKIVQL